MNNSYLDVIKKFVNIDNINKSIYDGNFPVYVTSRIYPDCILKFTDKTTAKLIKRSEEKLYSENSNGIFGKVGSIEYNYSAIDSYFKGSYYWIPVPEVIIKKELRRGLAIYKESGLPWTNEEYANCMKYSGESPLRDKDNLEGFDNSSEYYYLLEEDRTRKYIFDDMSEGDVFMHFWERGELSNHELSKLNVLIYEEIFCDCKNIIWID